MDLTNPLSPSGDFWHLITFANSLDPDQDPQTLTLNWVQTIWHSNSAPESFFNEL